MEALIEITDPRRGDPPNVTDEAVRPEMRRVTRMFASRNGELIRELVADSQGDPAVAKDFRDRFLSHHRARGAATLEKGIATCELRSDLDVEDALDILYGPLWLRLLVGHRPLNQAAADQLLDLVWPGFVNEKRLTEGRQSTPQATKARAGD